jgi:iron complex outermembrane recepter protein
MRQFANHQLAAVLIITIRDAWRCVPFTKGAKDMVRRNGRMSASVVIVSSSLLLAAEAIAADDDTLQEVVVTANKREQRLSDTGVTADVVSGDTLKQQQINSLSDLAQRTPSLSYASAPNGTPVYTLRGVGFYETSIGAYPSVSIYLDEAPLPFPVLTRHSMYDLERVEILKGPQGTLFGQNATGGAINYIAAKPTDSFQAGATLGYGRFNEVIGESYVSGPVNDTVRVRFAGRVERADGWQVSNSRPDDKNGAVHNYMGRLQVAFAPTDGVRFLLNLNGWEDKSEPEAGQHIALQFQNENLSNPPGLYRNPAVVAAPFSPQDPRAADWSTSSFLFDHKVPFGDTHMAQGSLRGDLDVADWGTLTSLSSYVSFGQQQGNDSDGLPLHALDVPLTLGQIHSFTQEFRFANGAGNPFRYVAGVNYEHDTVNQQVNIDYSDSSATIAFGQLFGEPIDVDTVTSKQRMTNYAGFGNIEYDLLSNLTLKAGARYTHSKDSADICQTDPQPPYYIGNLFDIFSQFLGGPPRGAYQSGECFTLNLDQNTFKPVVDYLPYLAPGEYRNTLEEHNVSWRVGTDYKITPNSLLYVNVSKGYKAGSFPATTGSTMAQNVPVKQESVLAYEGGYKAKFVGGRLQFNAAAFYYDYKDKQLRTKLNDPTFGQLDVLQNIPKSSVKGFEVELTVRPVRGLVLNAAYTYLDAKIDRFIGTDAGGDTNINFAGTRIPFTPKQQFAVSADYEHPLSSGLIGFVGATANHRSDTISTVGGDTNPSTINHSVTSKVYGIDAYTLVDAQLGIKSSDERWRAFLWGKNIFNEYYWSNVVSGYDTVSRFAGMPATYGVTFNYSFR